MLLMPAVMTVTAVNLLVDRTVVVAPGVTVATAAAARAVAAARAGVTARALAFATEVRVGQSVVAVLAVSPSREAVLAQGLHCPEQCVEILAAALADEFLRAPLASPRLSGVERRADGREVHLTAFAAGAAAVKLRVELHHRNLWRLLDERCPWETSVVLRVVIKSECTESTCDDHEKSHR
jgi:hypothetical protein